MPEIKIVISIEFPENATIRISPETKKAKGTRGRAEGLGRDKGDIKSPDVKRPASHFDGDHVRPPDKKKSEGRSRPRENVSGAEKTVSKQASPQAEDARQGARIFWSKMEEEEVLEYAKKAIMRLGIASRSELAEKAHPLYLNLLKRKLMDRIGLGQRLPFGLGQGSEFSNPPDKHCSLCRQRALMNQGQPCCCGCHTPRD